jgi:hypothetical protein
MYDNYNMSINKFSSIYNSHFLCFNKGARRLSDMIIKMMSFFFELEQTLINHQVMSCGQFVNQ